MADIGWMNFFWCNSSGRLQNAQMIQRKKSGCKKMQKCLRDIWRMNHFQVWEHLSPWARDAETRRDFSLYPSCFQSENILQCRPECGRVMTCERVSDRVTALSSKDGDRGRWGMGDGGDETEGGVGLCTERCCQLPQICVVSFLKDWAAGIYIKHNYFLNVRPGNAWNICNIPLSTSGVCVCGWVMWCRKPSVHLAVEGELADWLH